ncbi:glutamine synthetase family protein [Desulfonatronum parangueonense]
MKQEDTIVIANSGERYTEVEFIKIFFTDLNGRLRTLIINPEFMERIIEKGVGFDGSSIAGITTVDDSDRLLLPVPESYRVLEFANDRIGFCIARIMNLLGGRAQSDPRAVLERTLEKAKNEFGVRFQVAPEHEFFLLQSDDFTKNIHSDKAGYFHSDPHDKGGEVRNEIIRTLKRCGIRHEKTHHEVTASQHEINLEHADALAAADRTILFNYVAERVAAEHGMYMTLMPKPFDGQNRSAFHMHISMWDTEGANLFYDADGEYMLSRQARQFVAGILKYARQTSIIMASTYNSYKAYVAEREAPMVVGWGIKNRSSMVRLPYCTDAQSMRLELRSPDPSGNVYLQMAALIEMGIQGIREGIECGAPDIGCVYRNYKECRVWDERYLPRSMYEALVEAERSDFLRNLLGESIYKHYMCLKTTSWEEHRTHVTPRELGNYLMI